MRLESPASPPTLSEGHAWPLRGHWRERDCEQVGSSLPRVLVGEQLPFCDVADVLHFVNEECQFLSSLTPLQPRYAKQVADENSLLAVIAAQAMNHGNLLMSRTSDIPYHALEATHQQYLRLATLKAANDRISNAIAELPIFPHYSFDLGTLYASVDDQKFGVERPTLKARHSRKYFGRGKGMVAYTLLCQSWHRSGSIDLARRPIILKAGAMSTSRSIS